MDDILADDNAFDSNVYWALSDHQGSVRDVVTGTPDIGDMGIVKVSAAAQDTGYVMFTAQPFEEDGRFDLYTQTSGTAEHFLVVQYISGQWYFMGDQGHGALWMAFDPIETDLLVAEVELDGAAITLLNSGTGAIEGIRYGYDGGDFDVDHSGNNYVVSGTTLIVHGAMAINHIVYDSFGNVEHETDSAIQFDYGYTGQERDRATGLGYYGARYYDPATGRFLTTDPTGFDAGDPNLYRYVGNNPMTMIDPTGLEEEEANGGSDVDVQSSSISSGSPTSSGTTAVTAGDWASEAKSNTVSQSHASGRRAAEGWGVGTSSPTNTDPSGGDGEAGYTVTDDFLVDEIRINGQTPPPAQVGASMTRKFYNSDPVGLGNGIWVDPQKTVYHMDSEGNRKVLGRLDEQGNVRLVGLYKHVSYKAPKTINVGALVALGESDQAKFTNKVMEHLSDYDPDRAFGMSLDETTVMHLAGERVDQFLSAAKGTKDFVTGVVETGVIAVGDAFGYEFSDEFKYGGGNLTSYMYQRSLAGAGEEYGMLQIFAEDAWSMAESTYYSAVDTLDRMASGDYEAWGDCSNGVGMAAISIVTGGHMSRVGSMQLGRTIDVDWSVAPSRGVANLQRVSASEANAPFVKRDWNAPYADGVQARTFTTGRDMQFVRVHGAGNQQGAFLARTKEITGMTPQQIQQNLALPKVPTHVSDVFVGSGVRMQMGRIAAQPSFGVTSTRGIQYQLIDQIPSSAFQNMRPLP